MRKRHIFIILAFCIAAAVLASDVILQTPSVSQNTRQTLASMHVYNITYSDIFTDGEYVFFTVQLHYKRNVTYANITATLENSTIKKTFYNVTVEKNENSSIRIRVLGTSLTKDKKEAVIASHLNKLYDRNLTKLESGGVIQI